RDRRAPASALRSAERPGAARRRRAGGLSGRRTRRLDARRPQTSRVDGVAAEAGVGPVTARTGTTRRRLFDATMRLARGTGLAGVTVDDIAAEAGVAKGTVYYNFGSKDGLVEALLRYGVADLGNRMQEAIDEAEDATAGLAALVDAALEFVERYPG